MSVTAYGDSGVFASEATIDTTLGLIFEFLRRSLLGSHEVADDQENGDSPRAKVSKPAEAAHVIFWHKGHPSVGTS